jgi:hypothetical protein
MTETTSMTKKSKKPSAPKLFPDELIGQLLAQVQSKDAESIPVEQATASSKNWMTRMSRRYFMVRAPVSKCRVRMKDVSAENSPGSCQ